MGNQRMTALRIVSAEPEPQMAESIPLRSNPDESGLRRRPTADDLPDLTNELVELVPRRVSVPPPIPEAVDDYCEDAISIVDFEYLAKSFPPKMAADQYVVGFPEVPGIPVGIRLSAAPPKAPPVPRRQRRRQPLDKALALHVAVVWLSALGGGLAALL
jgi:hypothetical protein